jgi:hypothetical protein
MFGNDAPHPGHGEENRREKHSLHDPGQPSSWTGVGAPRAASGPAGSKVAAGKPPLRAPIPPGVFARLDALDEGDERVGGGVGCDGCVG